MTITPYGMSIIPSVEMSRTQEFTLEVYMIDVSYEQYIFIAIIYVRHLTDLQISETKFLLYKTMDQFRLNLVR